jgi:hypothetical protein
VAAVLISERVGFCASIAVMIDLRDVSTEERSVFSGAGAGVATRREGVSIYIYFVGKYMGDALIELTNRLNLRQRRGMSSMRILRSSQDLLASIRILDIRKRTVLCFDSSNRTSDLRT